MNPVAPASRAAAIRLRVLLTGRRLAIGTGHGSRSGILQGQWARRGARHLTDPDVRSALLEAFARQIARTLEATEVP